MDDVSLDGTHSNVLRMLVAEKEAAKMLGVSSRTVFTLADCGQLRAVYVGRRKLIDVNSVRDFVARGGWKGGAA
jgi:excisionase family DNA binding protein